jgi:hypothetical protein
MRDAKYGKQTATQYTPSEAFSKAFPDKGAGYLGVIAVAVAIAALVAVLV